MLKKGANEPQVARAPLAAACPPPSSGSVHDGILRVGRQKMAQRRFIPYFSNFSDTNQAAAQNWGVFEISSVISRIVLT